ncbi:MAG TPA: bifunctional phosphoribosylaminoimidazolecarboxamide formyltransferase/IMP cyclohydrolase, partial [Trebonia sp.]
MTRIPIRRALVSVYDKDGLPDLAHALHAAGVEIVSTGSTAGSIEKIGIQVTRVEALTGFPECLDGRVKTLHPKVHAGLLADMSNPDHEAQLGELDIQPFQLLVSNLYPFEETVAKGAADAETIEQIDIGGPAMVRAASKNHGSVAVVTSPAQYAAVRMALSDGGFTLEERKRLAAAAFARTAAYDAAVASWFAASYAPDDTAAQAGWPAFAGMAWSRAKVLRYGENPHQRAALYVSPGTPDPGIASAEVLHGKPMSYNNYVDADAARRAAYDFDEPCVAIIKHSNPCGIAVGTDIADAHAKAHATDPVSAFGGVIATNAAVTVAMAHQVADVFTEVVIAPDFEPAALEILSKSKNVRLLRCAAPTERERSGEVAYRPVSGGLLLQSEDLVREPGDDPANWELKAGPAADAATLADLGFAWRACRSVKSNAILLAYGGA